MVKMSKAAREAARNLAVCYDAWNQANTDKADRSIAFWGGLLLDAQHQTGVNLHQETTIRAVVMAARERIALADIGLAA